MEELLKIVQLVREEVPQARVKVDSLMVIHYFTIEELLNICNKYAKYYHEQQLKKSKSDDGPIVKGEQYVADYVSKHGKDLTSL